jgi:hypothetical protein
VPYDDACARHRTYAICHRRLEDGTEPNPEDEVANQDWRPFGEEEDQVILMWVDRIGNRWKRIAEILAQQFERREKLTIRHRARYLMGMRSKLQHMQQPVVSRLVTADEKEEEEQATIPEEPRFNPLAFFKTDEDHPVFA